MGFNTQTPLVFNTRQHFVDSYFDIIHTRRGAAYWERKPWTCMTCTSLDGIVHTKTNAFFIHIHTAPWNHTLPPVVADANAYNLLFYVFIICVRLGLPTAKQTHKCALSSHHSLSNKVQNPIICWQTGLIENANHIPTYRYMNYKCGQRYVYAGIHELKGVLAFGMFNVGNWRPEMLLYMLRGAVSDKGHFKV